MQDKIIFHFNTFHDRCVFYRVTLARKKLKWSFSCLWPKHWNFSSSCFSVEISYKIQMRHITEKSAWYLFFLIYLILFFLLITIITRYLKVATWALTSWEVLAGWEWALNVVLYTSLEWAVSYVIVLQSSPRAKTLIFSRTKASVSWG